jgi:hypothetical protein
VTVRGNAIFLTILLIATFGCIAQKPTDPSTADASNGSSINKSIEPQKYEVIDSEIPVIYYGTIDGVYVGYQVAPHIVALRARESFYDYQKTGNESELNRALFLTEYLISNATPRDNGNIVVWEFGFDWPVYPNLSKGWIGSLAQAGVLKVLMLAYKNTGEIRYLEYGDKALKAYSVDFYEGGLKVHRVDDGVSYAWYPEYASSNPPYVLNGFATSLIWIKEYHDTTNNPLAEDVFNEGMRSLIHFLPTYDFDGWSYYDAIGNNASVKYHGIHVYQMEALFKMTGAPLLQEYYLKWNKSAQ